MRISPELAAVVSGGASGLGAAVARMLRANGARVAILDIDEGNGRSVAAETGAGFFRTDVSEPASVSRSIEEASQSLGPVRICVCCAGIAPGERTVDREGNPHRPEIFERTLSINLTGTFNVATRAAAVMNGLEPLADDGERGVIVNTASVAAFEGQIGQIAYAASKGGVAAMTLPMARDLAKSGIRVMAIAPGLFRTPMVEGLPEDVQRSLGQQVPFPPRLGSPEEFAALVRHIVENPMLNGSVIRLDGAIRMGPR